MPPVRRRHHQLGGTALALAGLLCTLVALPAHAASPAGGSLTMVEDMSPGGDSNPSYLTPIGSTLYFAAADGSSGRELWRSDGTTTKRVKDIRGGSAGSNPLDLTAAGGVLYFTADDGTHGRELWESDGTATGTKLVKDLATTPGGSHPEQLTKVGTTLFLVAFDGAAWGVWRTDGSAAGTRLVKLAHPEHDRSPQDLVDVAGTLYFDLDGRLWKSDGTAAGTNKVAKGGSAWAFGSRAVYRGVGDVLMITDGSSAGTQIGPKAVGTYGRAIALGGTLVFVTDDNQLWKTDGTSAGTKKLKGGWGFSNVGDLQVTLVTSLGGEAYLFAYAEDSSFDEIGSDIWRTDGTQAGTQQVISLSPSGQFEPPAWFTPLGAYVYFVAIDGDDGGRVWRTNGTEGGTLPVADPDPSGYSVPDWMVRMSGKLWFSGEDATHGRELWSYTP